MKNLIIIGAGGMGREVYNLATQCVGYKTEFEIKGFLDDNLNVLERFEIYPPVIDTVQNYKVEEEDVFVCSIGSVKQKKVCIEKIRNRGGVFISLIHPTSLIDKTVKLGIGAIVFSYAQIGSGAIVGDYVLIQSYSGIAHDVILGDYSRIDVHALCVGGVHVGNSVTIHSGAVVNHKVVIEDDATIGAMSFVIRNVKAGCTVCGNPAKRLV